MLTFLAAALRAVALAALLGGAAAQAHEGHDHGEAPRPAVGAASPRGEASSDAFELVAVLRGGSLTVHLDRFATNEPIAGAELTLEGPDGPLPLAAAADGSYTAEAPWLAKPGHHDLLLTVVAGGGAEVMPVSLDVPEAAAGSEAAPASAPAKLRERLAGRDPLLFGVAGAAFLAGAALVLLLGQRRPAPAFAIIVLAAALLAGTGALAHEGHDHGEAASSGSAAGTARGDLAQRLPDGTVFVPKPTQRILAIRTLIGEAAAHRGTVELPGRIIPDPNASGVVQSSVGGRLSAPESGFPRLGTRVRAGDVLAYVTPPVQRIDLSDMRQRQGELDQQIATVQRRVERYQRLAATGAVSQVQLDEALDELRGLHDRRAALDRSRSEPEPLVAPVGGVVAESAATAGQMAQPGAAIFQIVDPARLWVEALSFEPMAGAAQARAQLADGRVLSLAYQGSGIADRNQSAPVHFAVSGDTAGLRIGQLVTVLAATGGERQGLALPRASVVRAGNGQDVVYEHSSAEIFAARPVRVEPLDGERVLVAAGLEPGKRVVTQGAELLDQVR